MKLDQARTEYRKLRHEMKEAGRENWYAIYNHILIALDNARDEKEAREYLSEDIKNASTSEAETGYRVAHDILGE